MNTYNDTKKYTHMGGNPDTQTFGGFSGSSVVHEHFLLKIPENLALEKVGPILCAGITLWDPLRHWGAVEGKAMTIGIVGIGGLGSMGIKLAKALGHTVYAFSTSDSKEQMAKEKGADVFVCSTDAKSMQAHQGKCDLILNTASAPHDLNVYLPALATSGTLVQLGLVTQPHSVNQLPLVIQRKSIAGSMIGSVQATQEVLDFCAKHQILSETKLIMADELEEAFATLSTSNKDGVRFIVDIQSSLKKIQQ